MDHHHSAKMAVRLMPLAMVTYDLVGVTEKLTTDLSSCWLALKERFLLSATADALRYIVT